MANKISLKPGKLYRLEEHFAGFSYFEGEAVRSCPTLKEIYMFIESKRCRCEVGCQMYFLYFLSPNGKKIIFEADSDPSLKECHYLNVEKLFEEMKMV